MRRADFEESGSEEEIRTNAGIHGGRRLAEIFRTPE